MCSFSTVRFLVLLTSIFYSAEAIVGGEATTIEEFPYQLSLQSYGSHICGASIISSTKALTAAHCTDGSSASSLSVVAGTPSLGSVGTQYNVSQVTVHPNYNNQTKQNDIAVLTLDGNIQFGPTVGAISVASAITPGGTSADLSGWGLLTTVLQIVSTLLQIVLTTLSKQQCQSALPGNPVNNTNICTYSGLGLGLCGFDIGSPLVSNGQLIGILSHPSCTLGNADVFTDVGSVYDFIAPFLE